MKVLKILVMFEDGGALAMCDLIEHESELWLVPEWLDNPARRVTKPARIIRLATLAHQPMAPGNAYGADYVLNYPLPRDVFLGRAQPQPGTGVFVIEAPDNMEMPGGRGLN
jgi:hypothetical protein